MTVGRIVHAVAGIFILVSVFLSQVASPYWLLLTAFVGLNLLQSSVTRWCLMAQLLRLAGVQDEPQGRPAV